MTPAGNLEVLRAAWDAYGCGRIDDVLVCLDPEVTFEPPLSDGDAGREALRDWLEASTRRFKSTTVVLETMREVADDCVIAFGRVSLFDHSGQQSNDAAMAWVAEFRDGLVVRAKTFADRDDALRYVTARRERS